MAEANLGLVIMGPSACGKSEVASAIASHYECQWVDADSLHSESNIAKMRDGIPLTDEDRFPWLHTVRNQFVTVLESTKGTEKHTQGAQHIGAVIACSALRRVYREILGGAFDDETMKARCSTFKTVFILLDCSEDVLQSRISQRRGHFMKVGMLQSQLKTLEKPTLDECAIIVNGNESLDLIVTEITQKLSQMFS